MQRTQAKYYSYSITLEPIIVQNTANLMILSVLYLPLQAVLDRQSSRKRLIMISSYLLMLYLNLFQIMTDRPKSSFSQRAIARENC